MTPQELAIRRQALREYWRSMPDEDRVRLPVYLPGIPSPTYQPPEAIMFTQDSTLRGRQQDIPPGYKSEDDQQAEILVKDGARQAGWESGFITGMGVAALLIVIGGLIGFFVIGGGQ
jgi:hypothetical protein